MKSALEKFSLEGRTAVVTGGSRGLGYNLARILAAAGAKVLISARTEADLKQAAERLSREEDAEVLYATVDLANRDSVKQFAEEAEQKLGHVDIFVGNAAMDARTFVESLEEETMDQLIATNLASNLVLTKLFIQGMKERGWGRIIYISSCGAKRAGAFGSGAYSATKSGLDAYARAVSVEQGPYGITANSVLPGAYMTDMLQESFDSMDPEVSKQFQNTLTSMVSLNRFGRPEELEGTVLLLASEAGSYISGQAISVDGGYTIKAVPS